MELVIVGVGYVGLSTALCFAEIGHRVVCVDSDPAARRALEQGYPPFYAPGLCEVLGKHLASGRLTIHHGLDVPLRKADAVFICVGTPSTESGAADLSQIRYVLHEVAEYAQGGLLLVNRSTVPPGTAEMIDAELRLAMAKRPEQHCPLVACNPEFLVQGASFESLMRPDRVVLGVDDPEAEARLSAIYTPWGLAPERLLIMNRRSAEMAKLAANTLLAARISLINEIAELCEKTQADTEAVQRAVGADPRIGNEYLAPGIGFGGPCLPKDVRAVIALARENDVDTLLLSGVLARNQRQIDRLFDTLAKALAGNLTQATIAVWGVSFKPQTDDLREAASVALLPRLLATGAGLRVFDPAAMPKARELFPPHAQLVFCEDPYACCEQADALLLLTEWPQFATPDWQKVAVLMRGKTLISGRNCWNPESLRGFGFRYHRVGQ